MKLTEITVKREKKAGMEKPGCCTLAEGQGILEDYHSGGGERELCLLSDEVPGLMAEMDYKGLCMRRYKANFLVDGLAEGHLRKGDLLELGNAVIEITMVKRCFDNCALVRESAACPLKDGGLFARVVKGGTVCVGDLVRHMNPS